MAKQVVTTIDIAAPAATVWQLLTDFPSYERDGWNDYIRKIEAPLVPGSRVTADTHTAAMGQRDLKANLVSVESPELSWEVKLPIPGLIHGKHYFRVEPLTDSSCRFVQGERISGLLTFTVFHLVKKSESGFVALNQALKERAEALSAVAAPTAGPAET